jgi:hypothetical protein
MSFIQIGFLGALAALAIPIIIHLVFRQRAKKVELGTLRFLRVVLEHNARRRRVMRWLLLMLRLACVGLLAFLFARPYLLASRSAGEKQTVVVLIDQSATMELKQQDGTRSIERAVAIVKDLLTKAGANSRFEIAFFDHAIHPLFEPVADADKSKPRDTGRRDPGRNELMTKLVAPEACHGGTDYGIALEWARDTLAKAPPGPRVLHILTDLQQSGLAWSEVDALPEDVSSHLHDLGRSAVSNLAVTEARPERAWLRPDEQTSLHVTVYNGSPFTASDLPVVLKLASSSSSTGGRTITLREQMKIEPGTLESKRFDLPPLADGAWQGTVSIETEDDLPADNVRHVGLLASKPYQVLLIDGRASPSPVLSSTYFFESALRLAPAGELYSASPFEPRAIAAGDRLPDLDEVDVVVLSDVGEFDRGDARALADFVKSGGGLLVFTGENVAAKNTTELAAAGLTVGQVQGIQHATDLPIRLASWDSKHPIFAPFADPQLGDLNRLSFSACTKIAPLMDAAVLARFRGGQPAVLERRVGKGSVVWFASTCDRQWSDWTRSRLYLPLVYQLLGHQSGLSAGGRVRQEVLETQGVVGLPGMPPKAMPTALPPGVHAQDGFTLVVNSSPREAETDRATAEEFASRFGLKIADDAVNAQIAQPERAASGSELIDSELWPWLAGLLLATLLAEALVANRTAG